MDRVGLLIQEVIFKRRTNDQLQLDKTKYSISFVPDLLSLYRRGKKMNTDIHGILFSLSPLLQLIEKKILQIDFRDVYVLCCMLSCTIKKTYSSVGFFTRQGEIILSLSLPCQKFIKEVEKEKRNTWKNITSIELSVFSLSLPPSHQSVVKSAILFFSSSLSRTHSFQHANHLSLTSSYSINGKTFLIFPIGYYSSRYHRFLL